MIVVKISQQVYQYIYCVLCSAIMIVNSKVKGF